LSCMFILPITIRKNLLLDNARRMKRPGHCCPGHPSIFRPPIGTGGCGAEGSQTRHDYTFRASEVNEKGSSQAREEKFLRRKTESSV
jgi:hypothetical protein